MTTTITLDEDCAHEDERVGIVPFDDGGHAALEALAADPSGNTKVVHPSVEVAICEACGAHRFIGFIENAT